LPFTIAATIMKKIKYFYNTHTLRYEKLETPLRVKLLRVFAFMATAFVTAALISYFAFQFVGSPNEKFLRIQNAQLRQDFEDLNDSVAQIEMKMAELEKRDNTVYRSIFEATPLPDSARATFLEKQQEIAKVESMSGFELVRSIGQTLNNLKNRIAAQNVSYGQINNLINNKEKLLAATPAIQPISNKDLSRIASGFGYRIDPIYKTVKMHAGLDFTAPQGTPIYATADGVIKVAGRSDGGYGNHVVINHGFGYETLYGHMYRIKARRGQTVKRGDLIGYVGSTGKSTGPHCHYEVHKNGQRLDPVYFFYNDLSPQQFDQLLKRASASNQSFD
ncbi:MAG TPA: M23 family metallopeptidase, partial [Flavisolibacter sp.]|nr:M23 family metallopeptidase [Flavisolibacter sp.]